MRKKYLSALLFGALLFASAGTFTSCKDYDDDIDNLQQQIDGLATKEDMQAKLDQMQTAVNDAKATAEEALEKANAAGDADKIAELEGRIAELEKTLGDIDAMKEEIQNALDSQIADFREEMEELLAQVEELTGYSLGMVTEISFQVMNNTSEDNKKAYDPNLDVNYARISKVTYPDGLAVNGSVRTADSFVFGEGKTGAFTIKKGDVNTVTDHMLVNINPANAAISNDMLSLVNADGVNLNEYVNLTSEPWSGEIIKTRSTQATGLRMVGVQLKKDVDFEAFDKLVLPDVEGAHATNPNNCDGNHNYIAYALAVTDAEKNRSVTSSYDVTLHVQAEKVAEGINEWSTISSNASEEFAISMYAYGEDAASGNEGCYPVEIAQPFQINVNSAYPTRGGRVMASYVTVDIDNNKLSTTDKAAIKALDFSGVDVVSTSNVHELSISGTYAAGIAVPLKLVTIDYTGNIEVNVVWVKAGEAATLTASYSLTPKSYVSNPTNWTNENELIAADLQEFTIPANTASYSISLVAGEDDHVTYGRYPSIFETATTKAFTTFTAELKDDNGNEFLTLYKDKNLNKATKISEVAYAAFTGKLNLQLMREGTTYEGTIKFYDASGTYLGANTIQVTKVLPTAVPSDFSAKTNGIVDGVMTVYPEPKGTPATGEYLLKQAFNNWENHYELNIDGIFTNKGDYDAGTGKGDNSTAKIESINVDVINDGKTYATTVGYNYGNILFIPEGHGVEDPNPCVVSWGTNFDIKFGCWPVDCTYQWSETPVVYYRETNIIKGKVTKGANGAVTAFENVIKATSPYKGVVDPFDATDEDWTTWAYILQDPTKTEIVLITDNAGTKVENEYFTAKFVTATEGGIDKTAMELTPTGAQVQVGEDIETKVILKITDKFGHTEEIPALTFTMKINHE